MVIGDSLLWGRSAAPGSEGSEGSKGSKGCGIALSGDEFYNPPAAVTSTWSIIIILTLVHPFATSWPSSPKGDARALRDWLSVSYSMISILVISRCAAPPYPAAPDFPPSGGQNKTPRDNLLINPPLEMTVLADTPPSFRPKRSGVEKSHSSMVKKAWRQEITRLRASWARFPSASHSGMRLRRKTDATREAAL